MAERVLLLFTVERRISELIQFESDVDKHPPRAPKNQRFEMSLLITADLYREKQINLFPPIARGIP